jgi:hypothetical protein
MKRICCEITQCTRCAHKDLMPILDYSMDGTYNLRVMAHETEQEIP